jgi:NADPH-dependent 2,4-dienoyl-CoA reductase/sulfur reductase-like enzyme
MLKVVVVGGGVAGLAAALAAAREGAKTTLVESSERVGLSRAMMPFLISEGWAEEDLILPQAASLSKAGVEVRTGETVTSVQHEERTLRVSTSSLTDDADRDGRSIRFDSVVICTGATSQVPKLRGLSKPNVFLLRGPSDYLGLSSGLDKLRTVAVTGPIPLALKLGEVMAGRRMRVFVYCGKDGLARQFSEAVAAAIRRKASLMSGRGSVVLVEDSVDAVLGVQRAEAVASSGSVQTCDGVVVIPRSVPLVPGVGCERGRGGGLLVDASMSTSLRGVFAAGDSAEIKFKSGSVPARLHSTSRMGGEVAGTNAAGGSARAAPSWSVEQTYFGLEFCSAGLGEAEALEMGLDATTKTGESREPSFGGKEARRETLVSLVFDKSTHQVYGLQIAGWRAASLSSAASLVVSLGLTVEQLAHLESPFSPGNSYEDSPIALTAGKILKAEGG